MDDSVFMYMHTYGGPELFMLFVVFVVTPFVFVVYLRPYGVAARLVTIAILWVGAFIAAYWDVYRIAREARRLCNTEAGMYVHRTVEAEGFMGVSDIEHWAEKGFRFVEMEFAGQQRYRYALVGGEVVKEHVDELRSRYEYTTDSTVLEMPFVRTRDLIRDRSTGEVLGEVVAFKKYPGWLDSRFVGLLGFSWTPPRCDDDYPPEPGKRTHHIRQFIDAVIKSKDRD
jgi:hypothetical protein